MRVIVNGEATDIDDGASVAVVVTHVLGDQRGVAVARNSEVVPRSRWDETLVEAEDQIEILRAAQGG